MDFYAWIARNCVYPLWTIKDGKAKVLIYLKDFEKFQYKSRKEIEEAQWSNLQKLIAHAYNTCSFYRSRFIEAGLKPSDIQDFSDYLKIPFLTKGDIQEHLSELISENYSSKDLIPNKTGGSTGQPIRYFHDQERMLSMEASAIRHDRWAGYNIGDKIGVIWGHRQDLSETQRIKQKIRNLLLGRSLILDSSLITEQILKEFTNALCTFKPKTILAYAKSMYFFAQYCKDHGIRGINPTSIITSAEVLLESERKLIEEVFRCRVFDRYGCREVSVIASECDQHIGLHINADTLYVEFIDDDGKAVRPGGQGNIIITDLLNYGMPFLRYKIEDMGVPSDEVCSCGRGLPLMKMVAGRTTDFIVTPKGTYVSGAALTIYLISTVPGIRQAQIVQDRVDHVLFKIVPGPELKNDGLKILDTRVVDFFGKEMSYDIAFVDAIPKEASGKFRFSISNIKSG